MTKADKEGQRKAPILRFKGFTDAWEQRQLNDIAKVYDGIHETPNYTTCGIPFVSVENIRTLTTEKYVSKSFYEEKFKIKPQCDDILMTRIGDIGTSNVVSKIPLAYYVSLALIRLNTGQNAYFFKYFFDSEYAQKELWSRTLHIAFPKKINKNEIGKINIYTTCIKEENKIAQLFNKLNNLLALYERKLKLLSQIKKYFLDNLFAEKEYPNLRFKGFTDAWEQRKLGEVATFINGRAYKQNELLDSGKYKVLRVGNFYTNDSWYYSNLELADKYYIDKDDLVYTWSATFGPHIWNGEKVIYHYHIWKIELSKFLDRDFTLQILEADKAKLLANTNGSTMIHVTKKDMESKVISLPTIEEQKQIGLYLTKFDTLITLYENKQQHLTEIKKNLLNTMFI